MQKHEMSDLSYLTMMAVLHNDGNAFVGDVVETLREKAGRDVTVKVARISLGRLRDRELVAAKKARSPRARRSVESPGKGN